MVDLDKEVVDLCKEHLPNHHKGAFDDPRLTLLHEDALAYLDNTTELFDVMIIDVPDPLEGGPAYLLYTEEFYGVVKSRLGPGGMVVTQAGPAGPINVTEVFAAINKTMARVFRSVTGYRTYIPSFGTTWGFAMGATEDAPDLTLLAPDEVDRRIAARITSELAYYDGVTHQGLMGLPKYIRQAIADETRVITKANPIYAI
jgi:spermidine synthase